MSLYFINLFFKKKALSFLQGLGHIWWCCICWSNPGVTPGSVFKNQSFQVWETIWDTWNWTQVGHMQGKCPTCDTTAQTTKENYFQDLFLGQLAWPIILRLCFQNEPHFWFNVLSFFLETSNDFLFELAFCKSKKHQPQSRTIHIQEAGCCVWAYILQWMMGPLSNFSAFMCLGCIGSSMGNQDVAVGAAETMVLVEAETKTSLQQRWQW